MKREFITIEDFAEYVAELYDGEVELTNNSVLVGDDIACSIMDELEATVLSFASVYNHSNCKVELTCF